MSRVLTPDAIFTPVQSIIAAFYEDRMDHLALEDVQQYFEEDGRDDLLAASYEMLLLNLAELAEECFRDDRACECFGRDLDRLAFARAKITSIVKELDDRLTPSIVCCSLVDTQGRSVVIGGYTEIHGQSGPQTHWMGVFRSETGLLAALRQKGLILISDIDAITDADILRLWRSS
jgi:hypothetical protein